MKKNKTKTEIIEEMRREIAKATEKIIERYERKYDLFVNRSDYINRKSIEYPERFIR